MDEQQQNQDQQPTQPQLIAKPHTFSEAPASWNIRYRVRGFDEQITLRGETYAEIQPKIDAARRYVESVCKADPTPKAAADAINTDAPMPPAAPPTTTQAAQQSATVQTIRAVKMTVTPRTDGKVDVKFFEAGHQYPDIYTTRTAADIAKMLQPTGMWTEKHFAATAEYTVNYVIDWKESPKVNSKGNHYKDIVTIALGA